MDEGVQVYVDGGKVSFGACVGVFLEKTFGRDADLSSSNIGHQNSRERQGH